MITASSNADSLGKLTNLGALAGVGGFALIGLALIVLTVSLIGLAGLLAQYQDSRIRGLPAWCWAAVVLLVPLLGTGLWALLARRRSTTERTVPRGESALFLSPLRS
ncbi:putative membrane protein YqjE [Psychromicrobium silvestre]|uniref:Putative membrane protein YqjE n=1 Tax=Psychromicrobium silvestre TaxID=1645614 RepID=A0A7Y9LW15_9MICC|nr:hypothetical protein [Psychromicrobium silvestre]NYE96654.1 putative membrane protein YqjE [Psychromicrobium silvestre]